MTTVTISNGLELYGLMMDKLGPYGASGWRCPMCREMGVPDSHQSDRLFTPGDKRKDRHPLRFVCRTVLAQAKAGKEVDERVHPKYVLNVEQLLKEYYGITVVLAEGVTWEQVAAAFHAEVGVSNTGSRDIEDADLWTFEQVIYAHKQGRSVWEGMGYSKEVIRRFHLGSTGQRLTIPIPFLNTGKFIRRTRYLPGTEITRYNPKYRWPTGVSPMLWVSTYQMEDVEKSEVCTIVEGDTSLLAAAKMFYPVATGLGGAATWDHKWTEELLLGYGFTKFRLIGDHDEAGVNYVNSIIASIRRVAEIHDIMSFKIEVMQWPKDTIEKFDVRDLSQEQGATGARDFVIENSIDYRDTPEVFTTKRIQMYSDQDLYDLEYAEAKDQCGNLDQLRGGIETPGSIMADVHEYITEYEIDGDDDLGTLLLFRLPPGVGKSRSLVRYVESYAAKEAQKADARAQRRITKLTGMVELTPEQEAELIRLNAGQYKRLSVVYVGPFVNGWNDILKHSQRPDLWYNFEARNRETCGQYDPEQNNATNLVSVVANKGYPIMKTLCIDDGLCPLKDQCIYMRQLDEVEWHPIAYLRHDHLHMQTILKKAKIVVVDEDPSAKFMSNVTITRRQVNYLNAQQYLEDPLDGKLVNGFKALVVQALGEFELSETAVSGVELVAAIREAYETIVTASTLREYAVNLVPLLDEIYNHRPMTLRDLNTAPHGQVPLFLYIVAKEIMHDSEEWNSRIHLINGSIYFYPMEPFVVKPKVPVIALDATGAALKYEKAFKRQVLQIESSIRSEKAVTTVLEDSEWTMQSVNRSVKCLTEMEGPVPTIHAGCDLPDNTAYTVNRDDFPDLNGSLWKIVRVLLILLQKHRNVLFVTYRAARIWIEAFMKAKYPEHYEAISYAHFYSLRGSNAFEDVPAVLVAGTPRHNPDALRAQLESLFHEDEEPITPKLTQVYRQHHFTNFMYPTLTLDDERLADLIEELEAGEIVQCIERIRPHTSATTKFVYQMTARPAARWVTSFATATDLIHVNAKVEVEWYVADLKDAWDRGTLFKGTTATSVSQAFIRNRYSVTHARSKEIWNAYREYLQRTDN